MITPFLIGFALLFHVGLPLGPTPTRTDFIINFSNVRMLAYKPGGNTLFFARDIANDVDIYEVSLTDGNQIIRRYDGHSGPVNNIVFQGDYMFTCADDIAARQWDTTTGAMLIRFTHSGSGTFVRGCVAIGPTLYTAFGNDIWKWDIVTGVRLSVTFLNPLSGFLSTLATDGTRLYAGSMTSKIGLWATPGGNPTPQVISTSAPVVQLMIINGAYLFAGTSTTNILRYIVTNNVLSSNGNIAAAITMGPDSMLGDSSWLLYPGQTPNSLMRLNALTSQTLAPLQLSTSTAHTMYSSVSMSNHMFFVGINGTGATLSRWTYGCDLLSISPSIAAPSTRVRFGVDCPLIRPPTTITIAGQLCSGITTIDSYTYECIVPYGIGSNRPVVVNTVGPESVNSTGRVFSFSKPVISNLQTGGLPVAGGGRVNITVDNMGGPGDIVMVRMSINSTELILPDCFKPMPLIMSCVVPAQAMPGIARFRVSVGTDETLPVPVDLDKPVVYGVSPNILNVQGGEQMSIVGNNFGVCSGTGCAVPNVKIGTSPCTSPRVISNTQIQCTSPSGIGRDLSVSIIINEASNDPNAIRVSYRAPIVDRVTPASYISRDAIYTVYGDNFGIKNSFVEVKFNAVNSSYTTYFAASPIWRANNMIEFKRNPLMAIGTDMRYYISVRIEGRESDGNTTTYLDYSLQTRPAVTNSTVPVIEDTVSPVSLTATDPNDINGITFKFTSVPLNGLLFKTPDAASGTDIRKNDLLTGTDGALQLYYKPSLDFNGDDLFTFIAIDNTALESDVGLVRFSVNSTNDAPYFTTDTIEIIVGTNTSFSFQIPVIDVDQSNTDIILYSKNVPSRGIWTFNNGQFNWNEIRIDPGMNKLLTFQHDNNAGAANLPDIVFYARDSSGAESATPLRIRVSVTCQVGQYNNVWQTTGALCAPCPIGAICFESGLYQPVNKAGYYKVSNTLYVECNPAEACPEGVASSAQTICAGGYTGIRCGQCTAGYYRSGNRCNACAKINIPEWVLGLLIVLALMLVTLGIYATRKLDFGFIGIFVTYVQTVAVLQTFKLNWPDSVQGLFSVFSVLNLNIELTSPECFVKQDANFVYEFKYYITLGLPLIILFSLLLAFVLRDPYFWFMSKCGNNLVVRWRQTPFNKWMNVQLSRLAVNKKRLKGKTTDEMEKSPKLMAQEGGNQSFGSSLAGVFIMSLKFLYLVLARKSLEIFNCSYTSEAFFIPEPNRRCFTEGWWWTLFPVALLSIMFYLIGIPLSIWYMYRKRVKLLDKPDSERTKWEKFIVQATYKEHNEFLEKYGYWDIMIMLRKLLIVSCQVFFTSYIGFQAVLLLIVFMVATFVQRDKSPYSVNSLNFLEVSTLISSVLVLFGGLMFYSSKYDAVSLDVLAYLVISLILACTLLVIFVTMNHIKNGFSLKRMAAEKHRASVIANGQIHSQVKTTSEADDFDL